MGNAVAKCKQITLLSDEDPDEDWKRQNKEAENNEVYGLVNLTSSGKLLEVYRKGGKQKLQKFIYTQITPYLLGKGTGCVISKAEYTRFKTPSKSHLPDKALLEAIEKENKNALWEVRDHEVLVCWDLTKRGSVGETPLHLCYLNNTREHKEIAECLLENYGKLVYDVYEGNEYFGESCLHLAVVNNDIEAVKLLVGKYGARIDQRATGRFFLPEDSKDGITGQTNYFGYAYFGEYPLAFAACMDNKDIYDYLIEMSLQDSTRLGTVDPNAKDSFGNTILHQMVIHNLPDMYAYVLKHPKMPADPEMINNINMTPLALACKLGRSDMFHMMMELSCMEFWRYGSVQCNAYPLQAVDSIGLKGEINRSGALMMIVDGKTDEHLEMLRSGVTFRLLEEKWSVFAKRQLTWRCLMAVLQILILSICVYTRPPDNLLGGRDAKSIVRYCCEIILCIRVVVVFAFEIWEISYQGIGRYLLALMDVPAKVIYLFSCLLILSCLPLRFAGLSYVEDILFIMSVPATWTYLLFFFRGIKSTDMGPLITMIYKMITGDLLRCGIIYLVFLLTFSPVLYYLYEDTQHPSSTEEDKTFDTAYGTFMALFLMTFGQFPYDELDHARIPTLAKLIFVAFSLLIPILLLNMLIAMMSNTFQSIQEKSKKEWLRQWAKIILVIERSLSKSDLLKYQSNYSDMIPMKKARHRPFGTSICASDNSGKTLGDPQVDEKGPGLIIVKSRGRSLAQARREAQAKWKLVGSNARSKLIQQKMGGDDVASRAESQQRRVLGAFSMKKLKRSGSVGPADI